MRTLLKTMAERLSAGEKLVLVTITAATGATPRGTGARMLVGKEGRICGTIGGGAVEYRAEQQALRVLESGVSENRSFSLNREDVQKLGMICGGEVNVFFQYIAAGDRDAIELAREAESIYEKGHAMWLICDVNRGKLSLYTKEKGVFGDAIPEWVLGQLSGKPKLIEKDGKSYCVERILNPGRVYIFGCGHVSRELQPLLTHVGFRCVMLDDREEFARKAFFPTAEDVRIVDFTDIGAGVEIGEEDYVCVMTRGHAYDTVIQAQVLRRRPCYVGVIGSRKKAAGVRHALKTEYGMTDEEMDLITTPIGLEIEAETPAEIAVSIAAQMIRHRAMRNVD